MRYFKLVRPVYKDNSLVNFRSIYDVYPLVYEIGKTTETSWEMPLFIYSEACNFGEYGDETTILEVEVEKVITVNYSLLCNIFASYKENEIKTIWKTFFSSTESLKITSKRPLTYLTNKVKPVRILEPGQDYTINEIRYSGNLKRITIL